MGLLRCKQGVNAVFSPRPVWTVFRIHFAFFVSLFVGDGLVPLCHRLNARRCAPSPISPPGRPVRPSTRPPACTAQAHMGHIRRRQGCRVHKVFATNLHRFEDVAFNMVLKGTKRTTCPSKHTNRMNKSNYYPKLPHSHSSGMADENHRAIEGE